MGCGCGNRKNFNTNVTSRPKTATAKVVQNMTITARVKQIQPRPLATVKQAPNPRWDKNIQPKPLENSKQLPPPLPKTLTRAQQVPTVNVKQVPSPSPPTNTTRAQQIPTRPPVPVKQIQPAKISTVSSKSIGNKLVLKSRPTTNPNVVSRSRRNGNQSVFGSRNQNNLSLRRF